MLFEVLLIFTIFVIGTTITSFFPQISTSKVEQIIGSLGMGTILIGWYFLLLIEVGLYTKPIVLSTLILLFLGGIWRLIQNKLPPITFNKSTMPLPIIGLIGLLSVGAYLNFRPHETIFGAHDAGVYLSLAGQMAREGDIVLDEPIIESFSAEQQPDYLRGMTQRGVFDYIWSSGFVVNEGEIAPPFFHLHPVWQSTAFLLGNGLEDALSFSPLWGLASLLVLFAFVRRLFQPSPYKEWIALLAVACMSISSIQIWFTRYSTTETLTQFCVWFGLWAWLAWADSNYKSSILAFLAGLGWSGAYLTRIDTFVLWGTAGLLVAFLIISRQWHRSILYFVGIQLLAQLHAMYHSAEFSPYYYTEIYGILWNEIQKQRAILPFLLIGGILVCGMAYVLWTKQSFKNWFDKGVLFGRGSLILFLTVAFFYNWFIRPNTGEIIQYINPWDNIPVEQWNHENLIRMQWYFTSPVLWMGLIGTGIAIWKTQFRSFGWLLVGIAYTYLYLNNIRSNGIHMYALRRFVPYSLPFFIIAITYLVHTATLWKRWAGVLLALIWIGGTGWSARGLISQVDNKGATEQFQTIAAQFEPSSILIFSQDNDVGIGDHIGVPLSLQYDHQVLILQGDDGLDPLRTLIRQWQDDGREDVYWIELDGNRPWPYTDWEIEPIAPLTMDMTALEATTTHRPTTIETHSWRGQIYRISE